MDSPRLNRLSDVAAFEPGTARLLSATHEEILSGKTTDVYFVKTRDILDACGRLDVPVVAEIFARHGGVFAGISEVVRLLEGSGVEILSLKEGDTFSPREVVTRISGPYSAFGMYETVILGMLASSTGWATAARECVDAAGGRPVLSFGARHVHPAVSSVMERAAVVAGGCVGASCILGAKLAGIEPRGTIPHAAILLAGDTLQIAKVYDDFLPDGEPRIILVDTFHDEAEESLRIASELGKRLSGVRLDTPSERGGVTPELVREVRHRLDMAGASHVDIIVSGGINPERIKVLSEAGAASFGVGSYIAHAAPRDMTMDIKVVDGKPLAKRGRIPGITENPFLERIL
ncbi:MAG: nicotinate phosphoribosyltransferase [Thermovirgaceae bacterium]|jgi:nicotinate phosphoribosyltransferase|nr:nicotinate phosphoribosyltransferase [Synergistales bacterium]MDI9392528.1 nicotinate phosphoribosyltransferase [Synergistota bacterium]MDY0178419.1 nicotinate phosphoribosyltransferase [Synergistaceae bacterium]HRW87971.1 nicotinate phosphoribosyltransferase [Thermovirgaceae bacterium]MDD3133833.1 nicotinate phosphoribosyltransferase [Synergistales bacterium]